MARTPKASKPSKAPKAPKAQRAPKPQQAKKARTLPIMAGVAAVSLAAGFALSNFVVNPSEAAAAMEPPAPGLVTVPIENRELRNDVILRGDVLFEGTTELQIEAGELGLRPIVTGMVPEVGDELHAGSVALEVTGRPVIVLPGDLPTFRTLRMGVSGPDVVQLKQALAALGINGGNPNSDVFTAQTAAGIAALYQRVGFPLPAAPEGVAQAQAAADQMVRDADAAVRAAEQNVADSAHGPDHLSIVSADAAINAALRVQWVAEAALDDQVNGCAAGERDDCDAASIQSSQAQVANAKDQVTVAQAARAALDTPPDLTAAYAALDQARVNAENARAAQAEANQSALPHLPAGEVVFLENLPRRVDSVGVRRGDTLGTTSIMQVSSADLRVTSTAQAADAALLSVGDQGSIELNGEDIPVTITEMNQLPDGRTTLTLTPGDLTPEQVTELRGRNVRVLLPVEATGGEVLTVPLAALTAGPGGESRIEVQTASGATELVEVTTGLAAQGHVEVVGVTRQLQLGELVVIGTNAPGS